MVKMLENQTFIDIRGYGRHLRVIYVLKESVFIKHFCKTRFKRKLDLRDFLSVTEESLKSGFDCTISKKKIWRQYCINLKKSTFFLIFHNIRQTNSTSYTLLNLVLKLIYVDTLTALFYSIRSEMRNHLWSIW